jgi:hypothetical protein
MEDALQAILTAARQPFQQAAVVTDSSFLLIYPPERELDVRGVIRDRCFPELKATGIPCEELDLSGFLFTCFTAEELADLAEDEFRNYRLTRQGLAARAERLLIARLTEYSALHPCVNLFVVSTVSLFPLVRYGEVLRQLRDLRLRLFIAFPGEERGGKLHFMNEPDGGNYLASKITFKI